MRRVVCRGRAGRTVSWVMAALLAGTPGAGAWQVDPGTAVAIATDPGGAAVYVDGEARGVTPLELKLAPGEYRVRVAKDGFLENSRIVKVSGQPMAPVKVNLTRAQVDETVPQDEGGGGGSKKALLIGLGVVAVGAGVFLATRKSDEAPTVSGVTVTPTGNAVMGATSVTFSAQASDPDGDPISYSWNFGDGSSGSGQTASHVYNSAGTFQAVVTATAKEKSGTGTGSASVRSLAGNWSGTVAGSFPFSFSLVHTGSSIGGQYQDADGSGSVSGSVTNPRAVRLTVNQPPFEPFTFTGNADDAVNVITGSALGFPFTMTRR